MASKKQILLPITLERRRIYIFPTGHGFVFIAVMFAMLLGSINYNNNLGFLLVFLLGGMTLVSIIHTYRNLLGLRVLSIGADPVFAGSDAIFSVHLYSGTHDRSALSLFLEKHRNVITNIDALSSVNVELSVKTQQRGVLRPDALRISSRYPIGLFRAWAVLRTEMSCLAYPSPVPGPMPSEKQGRSAGETDVSKEQGVDDFMGLKPYQPGDPIQHIAWKSLSRGLGTFTKDFAGQSAASVMFDFGELDEGDPEKRLSRLSHMVLSADRMQWVYGLTLPENGIAPDRGAAHKQRCLEALALFGASERPDVP